MEVDLFNPWVRFEPDVEQKMTRFMCTERDGRAAHELPNRAGATRSRVCGILRPRRLDPAEQHH